MGYEIQYNYQEKKDGVYKEEIKTLKKKLGEPFEEVSLDRLASAIMSQLARRDIFVASLTIHELIKKEVSILDNLLLRFSRRGK